MKLKFLDHICFARSVPQRHFGNHNFSMFAGG